MKIPIGIGYEIYWSQSTAFYESLINARTLIPINVAINAKWTLCPEVEVDTGQLI